MNKLYAILALALVVGVVGAMDMQDAEAVEQKNVTLYEMGLYPAEVIR